MVIFIINGLALKCFGKKSLGKIRLYKQDPGKKAHPKITNNARIKFKALSSCQAIDTREKDIGGIITMKIVIKVSNIIFITFSDRIENFNIRFDVLKFKQKNIPIIRIKKPINVKELLSKE